MYLLGAVPPTLRGTVRGLAAYDEAAGAAPVRRREAPTAGVTLVLGLGDPLRVSTAGRTVARHAFLVGLTDAASITEFGGHQAGVQVDLAPPALVRLLGAPPGGGPVDLDALADGSPAGAALARLPDRLADLPTAAARLAHTTAVVERLLAASASEPDPEVGYAWRRLSAAAGRVRVATLAHEVGWSRRHLTRRFTAQLGLTPTVAGRVLRFRRAADLLVRPPGTATDPAGHAAADPAAHPAASTSIAAVAARCGYADHAHLDREFRALAGCAPRDYVAEWAGVAVDPADVVRA